MIAETAYLPTLPVDLPQVDSPIFLAMARYMGTINKLKRAKTPEINQIYRPNRALKARASFVVPKAPGAPEPEIERRTLRKSNLPVSAVSRKSQF